MSDDGRFIWYELLTNDPDAALEFYQGLVGWGQTPFEGPNRYDLLTLNDMPVAGLVQLPEQALADGARPAWLGYVHVSDRDAAVAKAAGLGANPMMQMDIPEVGEVAVLQDPQGAFFGLYHPANPAGPEVDPTPEGCVSWHELATTDYEAAWEFYSQMFGWQLAEDMDMGEMGIYRMFGRGGAPIGGMQNKPAEMPVPGWGYYIKIPSCAAAAEQIAAAGGNVVNGPMEVPGGDLILHAVDPQGAMFALHQAVPVSAEA